MKTMLEITREELDKYDAFSSTLPPQLTQVVRSITLPTIPEPMKVLVALTQLVNFTAQFRRNLLLWDESTEIPTNIISFLIADSGGGKDLAIGKAAKCFKEGMSLVHNAKKERGKALAIEEAELAGEDLASEYSVYKNYLLPIPPVSIVPSTSPGLVKHVSDISKIPLEAAFLVTSELSDELSQNGDIQEIIKVLSELFDTGSKAACYTKGIESRVGALEGVSLSSLMVGSPGHLLYDEAVRKKFLVAFKSKLARRSFFCYVPDKMGLPDFTDHKDPLGELDKFEEALELGSKQAISAMTEEVRGIAKYHLEKGNKLLTISKEVVKLYRVYKRYNQAVSETLGNSGSTQYLSRLHSQWKALKVAASFAIMDKSETVNTEHFIYAIRLAEMFVTHTTRFEKDVNKANHERLSDYIHTILDDQGVGSITAHELKKQGYTSTINAVRLKELVTLCSGYDTTGIYSLGVDGVGITFEKLIKTDSISVSFKPIDTSTVNKATEVGDVEGVSNAKNYLASTAHTGFEVVETVFSELGELLKGDFAYSNFCFREGNRSNDGIIGGTKWLVLDVDCSVLKASEAHIMLSDINHHIALSSDPNNEYKFRVLLDLDSVVDLSPVAWRHFFLSIADSLAIKVDPVGKSQPFFSYANRQIFSQTEAEPLEVRTHILHALEKEANKTVDKVPSTAQSKALRNDPLTTYAYAFECEHNGSRELIRAAYHAKRIGCSLEETQALLTDINDYWVSPMEPVRFNKITEVQIPRIFQ